MSALERARRFPVTALAHPGVRKGLIGLLTFLALLAATAFHALPRPLEVRPGQIAPRDIEAPRTVEYVDEGQTAARRRLAAAAVEPVYRPAPAATAAARTAVRRVFDALLRLQTAGHLTVLERRAALREQVGVTLDPEAVAAGLSLDPAVLRQTQRAAEEVVAEVMADGVRLDQLDDARARVRRMLQASGLRGRALTVASAVGQAAVRPNLFVDPAATRTLRREAAEAVQPVRVRVLRGEVIVRRGDRITEEHVQRLAALGLLGAPTGWETVLGSAAVIALLLAVTAVYLVEYQREIWRVDRYLLLWSLVVVLTAVVARAVIASRYNVYLIPAAVGPILLATLLQPRLALLTSAVLALLLGLIAGGDYRLAVVAFVGGMVGVYAIRRINHRTDLVVAGLKVGLATAAAVGAVGLFERHPLYPRLVTDAAFGVANGLLVGIMSIGLLPYLEHLFGLVTPIKLLELSNPGHPLLRRLQLEAPGTYHHSIIVANLAEAAAEAIGADPLLVRVGTYYHDIGKIRRPVFFRENQIGVENPHERMSPSRAGGGGAREGRARAGAGVPAAPGHRRLHPAAPRDDADHLLLPPGAAAGGRAGGDDLPLRGAQAPVAGDGHRHAGGRGGGGGAFGAAPHAGPHLRGGALHHPRPPGGRPAGRVRPHLPGPGADRPGVHADPHRDLPPAHRIPGAGARPRHAAPAPRPHPLTACGWRWRTGSGGCGCRRRPCAGRRCTPCGPRGPRGTWS